MGKAFKWFRGLLGLRKPDPIFTPSPSKRKPKCHFVKSFKDKNKLRHRDAPTPSLPDHHAVAVVKLPSSGQTVPTTSVHALTFHEADFAAIKIQAAFRGFLARKALRALRGLVRLQALVRGQIERKRMAEWIQQMQALLRARAAWSRSSSELLHSDIESSSLMPLDPITPEKFEHSPHIKSTGSRFTTIDVEKTRFNLKPKSLFSSIKLALPSDAPSKEPATDHGVLSPFKFPQELEESPFFSASSRGASTKKSPSTPTKSNSTRNCFSGDSEYPSYMACTESSRAKMRSHSAPRQHPEYERSSSAKQGSVYLLRESRSSEQQISTLQSNFVRKAYPGSGRLDKLGMPVGYRY